MLKTICALLVVLIMLIFAARYIYQIYTKQVSPTLSTWILFFTGVSTSFGFYLLEENWNLLAGVNNAVDVAAVFMIMVATVVWGNRDVKFRPWEKYYLGVAALGVLYGMFSGDMFGSSLFGQVLICVGYIPMFHTMYAEGKHSESYTAWSLAMLAAVVGLVPSLADGGTLLASIYVIRTIVMCLVVLAVMAGLDYRMHSREGDVSDTLF